MNLFGNKKDTYRSEGSKLVPYPSGAVIPERDLGKTPVLEALHLGIDFGGLTAVDDFSLVVGKTEIAGLIGPNGAGKTTVFNLLTNIYQPTRATSCWTDTARRARPRHSSAKWALRVPSRISACSET